MGLLERSWSVLKQLGALGPLAVFMVVGPGFGAVLLSATGPQWFDPLAGLQPVWTVACFLAASALLAGLSLIPTHAVSLVAGLLFGVGYGTAGALLAIGGAAIFGYLVLRSLVGGRALRTLEEAPRAAAVHRALLQRKGRLLCLVLLIRLSPVVPFAGTNLLLAAAGVRFHEFFVGSMLGLAPRIVAVVMAGAGLSELDLSSSADLRTAVLGGVATVVVLFLMGRIARSALREATAEATA